MTSPLRSLLLFALLLAPLLGGGSSAWESNSFADFIKGRFNGLSLTRDGRLTLAPKLDPLFSSGEAGVWSAAAAPDGAVYLGTGHRGRVYRIAPDGKSTVLWSAPQPEVFALALDSKGVLYAGTSPNGRVWRIESGQAREYFNPGVPYIWSLAIAPDGALFVATGDNGRVYRVTAAGQGEVWYETGQTHVTSLALDSRGRLLAGTEPNGIVYRIEAKDKAFVLYDSSLPEIRSIVPASDGTLYVAALGGSVAQKQAQGATSAPAPEAPGGVVTTTITVTADDAAAQQGGLEVKPKPEAAKPPAAVPGAVVPTTSVYEMPGVERTAIYRIFPDNTAETLWTSKEENVFDLAMRDGEVVFSTDQRGRIYRLSRDLKASLLVETRESETTRLVPSRGVLLAATSNLGKLFRLESGVQSSGEYESAVHDAGNVARWGRLDWNGESNKGEFIFRTRSGNSSRPDKTWSEWSAPVTDPNKAAITSPNARYIQWQVELKSSSSPAPMLDAVTVTYQPQNTRPAVRSITVTPQWAATAKITSAAPAAAYSITVTDTGDAAAASSPGTPTQTMERSGHPQILFTWQADDPDNDKLVYSISYRGEDEREWKLLKADLTENTHLQDAEVFADGRYFFRVTASDRLANAPASSREAELISPPVLIDQTPPVIRPEETKRDGQAVQITFSASDSASPLRRAEYSLDASPWRIVEADDGITDSRSERFSLHLGAVGPGEHSVVIRVLDAAGNPGLLKIVLR